MLTLIDPIEVETTAPVGVEDVAPAMITTTLYDLIDAIQTTAESDDDAVVIATLLYILRSSHATWHGERVDDLD